MAMPEEMKLRQDLETAKANELSFDFEKFDKELQTGDILFMFIRSHLYLEHVLITMILEACKNPEEMTMRNVNFPTKVDLAIGLCLIEARWRKPLLRFNTMRNRVAHRLTFEFTEQEKRELIGMLPGHLLDEATKEVGLKPDETGKLEWFRICRVIVVWLDVVRQRHQEARVKERYSIDYLRLVVGERN